MVFYWWTRSVLSPLTLSYVRARNAPYNSTETKFNGDSEGERWEEKEGRIANRPKEPAPTLDKAARSLVSFNLGCACTFSVLSAGESPRRTLPVTWWIQYTRLFLPNRNPSYRSPRAPQPSMLGLIYTHIRIISAASYVDALAKTALVWRRYGAAFVYFTRGRENNVDVGMLKTLTSRIT